MAEADDRAHELDFLEGKVYQAKELLGRLRESNRVLSSRLEDAESRLQEAESAPQERGPSSDEEAAELAILAVERLKADVGIPARMSDVGVQGEQLEAMAEKAAGVKRILRVNPRPATQEDLKSILESAL